MLEHSPKVSAVLIAFNEEADIGRALESVSWCDEIVVVDSGSSDRTVAICERRGCKVLHREFRGYGDQKAFAVSQATHDWVLSIDADEQVSDALREEIQAALAGNACRGYQLPITTILWDQELRTPRRHTAWKLRLFDRRCGNFGAQIVHESVALELPTRRLTQPMYNYSYSSIADYFGKFNAYTTAAALEAFHRGKRARFLSSVALFPLTFFKFYFLRGFLWDGSIGFTWSLFSALYPAVKQFKLLELRRAGAAWESSPDVALEPAAAVGEVSAAPSRVPVRVPSRAPLRVKVRRAVWRILARRRLRSGWIAGYLLALGALGAAIAVNNLFGGLFGSTYEINYVLLFLVAIIASARFWGIGPALTAAVGALLGFDYFVLPPLNQFSVPDGDGLLQLSLFAVLSSALVYAAARRRSSR